MNSSLKSAIFLVGLLFSSREAARADVPERVRQGRDLSLDQRVARVKSVLDATVAPSTSPDQTPRLAQWVNWTNWGNWPNWNNWNNWNQWNQWGNQWTSWMNH
jgi:hypothetical protein